MQGFLICLVWGLMMVIFFYSGIKYIASLAAVYKKYPTARL